MSAPGCARRKICRDPPCVPDVIATLSGEGALGANQDCDLQLFGEGCAPGAAILEMTGPDNFGRAIDLGEPGT